MDRSFRCLCISLLEYEYNGMLRASCLAVITGGCLLSAGCGGSYYAGTVPEEYSAAKTEVKVEVEAFLFDSRIRRDGKPTSFRLELFRTDSIIALSGRGYLGKGALRGRMTADSLEIYFPASNEYLYESLGDIANSSSCPEGLRGLDFLGLLTTLPTNDHIASGVAIECDSSKTERRHFTLTWVDRHWEMKLEYDRREIGWRLLKLSFVDDKTSFKTTRRSMKRRAEINQNRFRVFVPEDALKIIP